MPLFSLKFSPKKVPARKQQTSISTQHHTDALQNQKEFNINYGPVKMRLGDTECQFHDGSWIVGGSSSVKELSKVKKQNLQLVEENNMLKLKVELLLDMLAETTAEYETQQAGIEELKRSRRF